MPMLSKPPYAAHNPSEKSVPSIILNEVTAKSISNATPLQPSLHVVAAINKAMAEKPGNVTAARSLRSTYTLVNS
jgi:hypothetical protein